MGKHWEISLCVLLQSIFFLSVLLLVIVRISLLHIDMLCLHLVVHFLSRQYSCL